ncbi:FAD-binding oxidoreductase [Arthrobacter halodurans]|uniref:FAD-binding oxidoreductase n=1 Tax=Arthrobacter halodurans TaxID=516699 RepID=A0ABV4UHT6_9MICC
MSHHLPQDTAPLEPPPADTVIAPDHPDYDTARRLWNADIDRRPALIVRCASPQDVSSALSRAQTHNWEVAVRGGAHSTSGASSIDGGLVIDLSTLRGVSVDPVARRVRAGGGALLSDVDAACQEHGLAVPAGIVSHTGVGGLTLGGGMGWLTRREGLTIDNLLSAEVVLANGDIVHASKDEHPDLFWALRGGGGNFGVVTEFEFVLHEVGPMVDFGLFFWPLDQGSRMLRWAREIIPTLPRDLNVVLAGLNAPPAPFVPEQYHFQPGYALLLTGFGPTGQHAGVAQRIRTAVPPLFDMVSPMPYTALQQLLDEANAWGMFNYEKATYLPELTDEAIDTITHYVPRKNNPLSVTLIYRLDGAYSDVGEGDTAFGGRRTPRYSVFIIAVAPEPEQLPAERTWVRDFWDALQPAAQGAGAYVNTMAEYDDARLRATYGAAKLARLAGIKAEYDPGNVFRHNVNITPA